MLSHYQYSFMEAVKKYLYFAGFTTGFWTGKVSPMPLSSTAVWMGGDFPLNRAATHAKHILGSHFSQAECAGLSVFFCYGGFPRVLFQVVFEDHAKDMLKAMADAALPSLLCVSVALVRGNTLCSWLLMRVS